eukprot:Gb_06899 [translate_table: standard]
MEVASFHRYISCKIKTCMHIHMGFIVDTAIIHHTVSTSAIVKAQPREKPKWESQDGNINTLSKESSLKQAGGIVNHPIRGITLGFNDYAASLQVCSSTKELKKIHAHILLNGLEQNVVLVTKLVTVYAMRGSLESAQQVFDTIYKPNVFLWNAIIRGYARNGRPDETLRLYYQMQGLGIQADNFTFPFVLKACADLSALQEGKEIHYHIVKSGFEYDVYVGNALIDMYAKCASIKDARQVFDRMSKRDVVSWTAMLAGYSQNGHANEALALFHRMHLADTKPNPVTFVSVLPVCVHLDDLQLGKRIHAVIIQNGYESDVSVGTALIDMYGKIGSIEDARQVFDQMSQKNVISWTAIITGYTQNERGNEALELFQQMQLADVMPDSVTIVSVLSACADLRALHKGKCIHDYITRSGLESNVSVGNSLVAMYAKCGSVNIALELFHKVSKKNVVSWNAMITGYAQNGHANEALELFHQMQLADVKPNSVTMVSALSACAHLGDLQQGKQMHTYIIRGGFESNVFLRTALIDMYAKCGNIKFARELFDTMRERNVVSWSAMIAGYALNGHATEALALFHQMQFSDVKPNLVTIVSVLPACSHLAALEQGKWIHEYIIRNGFEPDGPVGTALVDMYAKCGNIEVARQLFDTMSTRDVVSWNVMISGYAQNGHAPEALTLFHKMQLQDVKPNSVTMVSVLPACAHLAALQQGKWIHDFIIRSGLETDVSVGTALIDMYAKCGNLNVACQLFEEMSKRDVVLWNTMITGYGMHGNAKDALALFVQMQRTLVKPNHVTFICVLSACSHAGLVDEGWQYFNCMSQDYHIIPRLEHYACMVDLLGRAGHLDKAQEFIKNMPLEPDAGVWGALFSACRIYGNIPLGERMADHLFELEPENAGYYVQLANIYAAAGRWDDVAKVRTVMKNMGLKKTPGCSLIEVNNGVHAFLVEDT